MQSKATTVAQYLAELPDDRRTEVEAVRSMILANLGEGYEEGMQYGMIGYYVPHSLYPAGYHCDPKQPLGFAALASQKNHLSLYLMCMYDASLEHKAFVAAWKKTGKKLDMGKCCIRFKKADDLAMDVLAQSIRNMPVKKWLNFYETTLRDHRKQPAKKSIKPAPKAKAQPKPAGKPKPAAKSKSAKSKS